MPRWRYAGAACGHVESRPFSGRWDVRALELVDALERHQESRHALRARNQGNVVADPDQAAILAPILLHDLKSPPLSFEQFGCVLIPDAASRKHDSIPSLILGLVAHASLELRLNAWTIFRVNPVEPELRSRDVISGLNGIRTLNLRRALDATRRWPKRQRAGLPLQRATERSAKSAAVPEWPSSEGCDSARAPHPMPLCNPDRLRGVRRARGARQRIFLSTSDTPEDRRGPGRSGSPSVSQASRGSARHQHVVTLQVERDGEPAFTFHQEQTRLNAATDFGLFDEIRVRVA
jgi:hypothetical protein